jgi:hypothetical protein
MSVARTCAILTAALLLPCAAFAAPCGRPDVDATFPPDNAESVPSNAILSAHYSAPALYDDEPVVLTDGAGNDIAVTTSFDKADTVVRAQPDAPLADGSYTAEWPTLRGVSGGGVGLGKKLKFTVQGVTDMAPPTFAGLTGIDWDLSRDKDPCTDRLEDRFVFKLKLGAAADDAGAQLLAVTLFETKDPLAPEQTGPSKVALRPWPTDGRVELRRPANKAGDTCFAAITQDLVGSVSGGGEREVCVKTQKPPFFDGCSVLARDPSSPGSALFILLAALGSRLRGRGRRAGRLANRTG